MEPEIKAKWIAALRSGKYRQMRQAFLGCGDDGGKLHCCLAVLADVVDPNGWDSDVLEEPGYQERVLEPGYQEHVLESDGELTGKALHQIKMTPSQQSTLIAMNDRGKSFAEIADYIEKNL